MSMTSEEILTAMQTIVDKAVDKAQAATDQKLTSMQATTETTQKETIDILREEIQNIAEATANKIVQRFQAILETENEITTLKHIVADHSVRIKKLEEATFKKA